MKARNYCVEVTYDGYTSTNYLTDTINYIKENTTFFKISHNENDTKNAVITLASKHGIEKYHQRINKLLDEKSYYELAVNLEEYTDLYILSLECVTSILTGAMNIKPYEITERFSIKGAYGFIAVKKDNFSTETMAKEYMLSLINKYTAANNTCFYKAEIYNDNEHYIAIMDEKTYDELETDDEIVEYVLNENGIY